MKNIFTTILLLVTVSCGASRSNQGSGNVAKSDPVYTQKKYKPATKEEWEKIRNSIMFINTENDGEMLLAPSKRNINYRASLLLPRIHSWFEDGRSFERKRNDGFELLVLKKIPKQVLAEIINLAFEPQTGFGILDKIHWTTLGRLQDRGYNIALIENYSESIAGLYIESSKTIAFDVFSNSGTLTHELRHEQQHKKLVKYWFWDKKLLADSCIQELSLFFGELDASTEQLPEWKKIVETANYTPTVEEFNSAGGKTSFLAFFKALSANLYYPVNNSVYALNSNSCPDDVKDAVLKVSQVVGEQKEKFFSMDINFLRYKARNQVVASLNKMESLCADPSLMSECNTQVQSHDLLWAQVKESLTNRSKMLEGFYSERKNIFPQILSTVSRNLRGEMCNRVGGYYFIDSCSEK